MSWSWTLYRYLAVQFLIGVILIYAIFLMLAFSIDIVELLNRTASRNVPTATAIGMAVLQLPNLGQKMLPFAILLGGVFTFVRLSRSRELVATRELRQGDVMLMIAGGHGFRMLEDTILLEIKQGPYTGIDEKERF